MVAANNDGDSGPVGDGSINEWKLQVPSRRSRTRPARFSSDRWLLIRLCCRPVMVQSSWTASSFRASSPPQPQPDGVRQQLQGGVQVGEGRRHRRSDYISAS